MTYTEIVILAVLTNKDRHGYDIKKVAENIFGDNLTINNNTLYMCLHKFEEMGAVISKIEHINGKPDRHVYRITDRGKEIFRDMILDYSPEIADSDYEFYARVAFFQAIEPKECLDILGVRKASLIEQYGRLNGIDPSRDSSRSHRYDAKVVRFMKTQVNNEIEWVRSLEAEINGRS